MRMMAKNKQNFFIANRLNVASGRGAKTYGKPFAMRENLAPVDSESEIKEYGERHFNMYKTITSKNVWYGRIKEGDVAYLDGVLPDGEEIYGCNANYRVESIRTHLTTMTIYFEKV